MGSKGERGKRRHLAKAPKYEEPNTFPAAGLGGGPGLHPGRYGHSADHHHAEEPGPSGKWFLRILGLKPKNPDAR
jgi:hypothetical protein